MMNGKRTYALVFAIVVSAAAGTALWWLSATAACTSVEEYDFWSGTCQFECESDAQCAARGEGVDAELNAAFGSSKVAGHKKAPTKIRTQSKASELYTSASTGTETDGDIYTVQPDGSLRPDVSTPHKHLWDLFKRIGGEAFVTESVLSFEIFDDADDDTAAAVWRSTHNPNKWHVSINAAFKGDRKDLVHTIVHEYAHILTLSGRQVAAGPGPCPRFALDEGCAGENSYIQRFHTRFWAHFKGNIPANDGEHDKDVDRFYAKNAARFVSDYAATNPAEDIAESFTHFVLRSMPAGSSEQEMKIRFFHDFPELVTLRDRMRVAIGADLLKRQRLATP